MGLSTVRQCFHSSTRVAACACALNARQVRDFLWHPACLRLPVPPGWVPLSGPALLLHPGGSTHATGRHIPVGNTCTAGGGNGCDVYHPLNHLGSVWLRPDVL
jgi:hypothetical protein